MTMTRYAPYIALLAACAFLFLWRLGSAPLIGRDEGTYAECSREMLASGDYAVPRQGGAPFLDKPPLCFWLQAASMRVFGVTEFAARLPSALAGAALVVLTALLGTLFYGKRAGMLAGFALATSMLVVGASRLCLLDGVFTLAITASLAAFLMAHLGLSSRWMHPVFWAMAGVSVLVKGPAGAVVIFAAAFGFLAIRRRLRELVSVWMVAGLGIFAAVTLPWYLIMDGRTNGEFLREFLVRHNIERAMGVGFQHNMPLYFYLPVYLVGFFPWSLIVPLAWKRHVRLQPRDQTGEASLFLAVWIAATIGLFSLSRSKLPNYILPALPPSAILAGLAWSRIRDSNALRRCAGAILLVSILIAAGLLIGPRFLPDPIPGLSRALVAMGAFLIAGSVAAFVLILARRTAAAFAALCLAMCHFLISAIVIGMPVATRKMCEPVVEAGRRLCRCVPADTQVVAYGCSPVPPALAFYAQRPIRCVTTLAELRAALGSTRELLIITRKDIPAALHGRAGPYLVYRLRRQDLPPAPS